MKQAAILGVLTSLAVVGGGNAAAQTSRSDGAETYPSSPVRIIVPFEPAGGIDIIARKIGHLLSESFKQNFVVENRAGAGGLIGMAKMTNATPNGYTITMGSKASISIAPYTLKDPPYDPLKDVAAVTLIAGASFVLAVTPKLPLNSLSELIAYARANPRKLNYGSAGTGTTNHLGMELLWSLAGVSVTHVPFKSAAPANIAVIAAEVDLTMGPLLGTAPQIKSRQVKAFAVTGLQRDSIIPDVPTVAESGYPGFQWVNWYGMLAPARTPARIINLLNREIVRQLADPDLRRQLASEGAQVFGSTPKEFTDFIRSDVDIVRKLIKTLNLVAN
jgi:tripartite-type tricarboxylate transporter receptor subunit TctC